MLAPEYLAVLDPFADEAKRIVEASPPFEAMPPEIVEQAVNRVKWKDKERSVENNLDAIKADVFSFYLMCQAVASVSPPGSKEVSHVSDAIAATVRYRMFRVFKIGQEELYMGAVKRSIKLVELEGSGVSFSVNGTSIPREDTYKLRDQKLKEDGHDLVDDRLLRQYLPKFAVRWTDLAPLLRHGRKKLTDFYLINGWVIVTQRDLWGLFGDFVAVRAEEYIQSVYEKIFGSGAQPSGLLSSVGERISALLPKETSFREQFSFVKAGKLQPEFFPPCVNLGMNGVGSGLRNYAIMVLLAPFLSYARVAPSGRVANRMADFIKDISIVREEIAPIVFEAAERCNPPYFKDQPQEKAGVFYHMGFGMTDSPTLADSGRTKWYRPPNCAKIQSSAPPLCKPDEFCPKIKNPLTYYFRKKHESSWGG